MALAGPFWLICLYPLPGATERTYSAASEAF